MELIQIGQKIKHNGKFFIPIVELCKSQLYRIWGKFPNKDLKIEEILIDKQEDPIGFGVIAYHYDTRIGFTLNLEDNWKEFKLSCGEGTDMMLNQLEMFDKLREWGFKI